jgi:acyl-CoA reductase-like NAD-dependent aldehyde dehydrogenase
VSLTPGVARTDVPVQNHLMWIDGAPVEAVKGEWRDSIDPFTGQAWARVADGSVEDVDRAVASSRAALESGPWSQMNGRDRRELMLDLARLLRRDADELAELEARDNGKLFKESVRITELSAGWYEYFAGWADKLQGDTLPVDDTSMLVYTRREPVGVVAALTAWNSPMILAAYKLGPGLAAGCTFVVKPSEEASLNTLAFARLVTEAGFPPGVVNVVTGDGLNVGQPLVSHPGIDKVAFTGSAFTGSRIAQAAGARLTPVMLELGGKSPQIVFDDADLETAARGIAAGIFSSAGQACVAGSRLFAHRAIADELGQRILAEASQVAMGDPLAETTAMGPLAFRRHLDNVLGFIDRSRDEGASVLTGGVRATRADLADGYFVEPTVIGNVTAANEVMREEVFGPVLAVTSFEDEAEVLKAANDSQYGLAAGLWTRDLKRAHRVAHSIQSGTVWVNAYRIVNHAVPFGGWKNSGYGVENGAESLREFTKSKVVWIETD